MSYNKIVTKGIYSVLKVKIMVRVKDPKPHSDYGVQKIEILSSVIRSFNPC